MGTIHANTTVDIRYTVTIKDTPYIVDEVTNEKTEGTPVVTSEIRSNSMTMAALLASLLRDFKLEIVDDTFDTSKLVSGYVLSGEFSDTSAKRHEVSMASPLTIKDSLGGGYTQIKSIKMQVISDWKQIICQGGRRGTFTTDTKIPLFRTGDTAVSDIEAGAVILCDDGGDLAISVVLLVKPVTSNTTASTITTASGTYDAGGFSLNCA